MVSTAKKPRQSRTVLIKDFGFIWRMPRSEWRRWLEAKADGKDLSFDDLSGARIVGVLEGTVTDMDAEAARFELEGT